MSSASSLAIGISANPLKLPCLPHPCLSSCHMQFISSPQITFPFLLVWKTLLLNPKFKSSLLPWPFLKVPHLQVNSTMCVVCLLVPGASSESRKAGMSGTRCPLAADLQLDNSVRMLRQRRGQNAGKKRVGPGHRVDIKESFLKEVERRKGFSQKEDRG